MGGQPREVLRGCPQDRPYCRMETDDTSETPGDEYTVDSDPALAAETVGADPAAQSVQPLGTKRKRQHEGYYRDLHRGKKD